MSDSDFVVFTVMGKEFEDFTKVINPFVHHLNSRQFACYLVDFDRNQGQPAIDEVKHRLAVEDVRVFNINKTGKGEN